ncbi:hypothetical protein HHI36_001546 [Cryptolaemus montrouzieri]|uniref:Uncharacterized protein n=1 Tax=Cryptolaemus montrouzieri TaxID=559131 RepID=A0ABD2P7X8_9CUCU
MQSFEFVFLFEFMHLELDEASRALAETNAEMQIYRNDFESFKCKASETARKYVIDPNFKENRQKYFDELAYDYQFHNRE